MNVIQKLQKIYVDYLYKSYNLITCCYNFLLECWKFITKCWKFITKCWNFLVKCWKFILVCKDFIIECWKFFVYFWNSILYYWNSIPYFSKSSSILKEQQKNTEILYDIPEDFLCPITREIMEEPVVCEDGYTYDKAAIISISNSLSPITCKPINKNKLIPNRMLKQLIEKFIKMSSKKIILKEPLIKKQVQPNKINNINEKLLEPFIFICILVVVITCINQMFLSAHKKLF